MAVCLDVLYARGSGSGVRNVAGCRSSSSRSTGCACTVENKSRLYATIRNSARFRNRRLYSALALFPRTTIHPELIPHTQGGLGEVSRDNFFFSRSTRVCWVHGWRRVSNAGGAFIGEKTACRDRPCRDLFSRTRPLYELYNSSFSSSSSSNSSSSPAGPFTVRYIEIACGTRVHMHQATLLCWITGTRAWNYSEPLVDSIYFFQYTLHLCLKSLKGLYTLRI